MEKEEAGSDESNKGNFVDFNALILGLSSAALHYLGHPALEGSEKVEVNLELAKQNIDIIRLLHLKTKGNLTVEESDLLIQVLADLTDKFVLAQKK